MGISLRMLKRQLNIRAFARIAMGAPLPDGKASVSLLTPQRLRYFLLSTVLILVQYQLAAAGEAVVPAEKRAADHPYRETLETTPSYRSRFNVKTVHIDMVPIPAGEFLMGTPLTTPAQPSSESPQHKVRISPFWMSKFETTWELYYAFECANGYDLLHDKQKGYEPPADIAKANAAIETRPNQAALPMPFYARPYEMNVWPANDYPASAVTPYCAQMFCRWLTVRTGRLYRLPTEAEWEYAARAGTTTAYFFGDDPKQLDEYAWYGAKQGGPHPVGQKKPNPWGLYDMYGNIAEWTLDGWTWDYGWVTAPISQDPWAPYGLESKRQSGSFLDRLIPGDDALWGIARGGSWTSPAKRLRSASRQMQYATGALSNEIGNGGQNWHNTSTEGRRIGFRIVSPVRPESDGREKPVMLDKDAGS